MLERVKTFANNKKTINQFSSNYTFNCIQTDERWDDKTPTVRIHLLLYTQRAVDGCWLFPLIILLICKVQTVSVNVMSFGNTSSIKNRRMLALYLSFYVPK